MKTLFTFSFLLVVSCLHAQFVNQAKYIWSHISSEYDEIEQPNNGKFQTGCLIGDLNKDGSDEFIIIENTESPSIVMYVHTNGKKWEKYAIDKRKIPAGEAADLCDIDGDGNLDIAVGSEESKYIWWWENPYPDIEPEKSWKRNYINKNNDLSCREMVFGDFDGDGSVELAFWNKNDNSLYVAQKPENVFKTDNWSFAKIYTYNTDCQMLQRSNGTELKGNGVNYHSGLYKADINLDGVDDIVAGGMYFNFKDGQYISNDIDLSYISAKTVAGQLIEGGRPEVVMATMNGEGPLVMYSFGNGVWEPVILQKLTRKVHSLQLIDFDKDGDLDIYVAEMKTAEIKDPKIFILLNNNTNNFEKIDVATSYGSHNSGVGDFDGDGDYDIIAKPYAWDTPRIDLWLNQGKK